MCSDSEEDAPPPSPYETEMLNQAERRLKEYQDTFVPLESAWMEQQKMYGSDIYRGLQKDKGVAASRMTNSGATLAGPGTNPGSGNYLMQAGEVATGAGMAAGMSAGMGAQTALDKAYGGSLDVVKLGRNQTATSANMNANLATQQAGINAAKYQAARQEKAAMYGAIGTAAGMAGYAGYQKWNKPKGTVTDPVD